VGEFVSPNDAVATIRPEGHPQSPLSKITVRVTAAV
jgi:hypothetical protein